MLILEGLVHPNNLCECGSTYILLNSFLHFLNSNFKHKLKLINHKTSIYNKNNNDLGSFAMPYQHNVCLGYYTTDHLVLPIAVAEGD